MTGVEKGSAEVVETDSEEDTGSVEQGVSASETSAVAKQVTKVGGRGKKRKGVATEGTESLVQKKRKCAAQDSDKSKGKSSSKPAASSTKPAKKRSMKVVTSQLPPAATFRSHATLSDTDESGDDESPSLPENSSQHASNVSTTSTALTTPTAASNVGSLSMVSTTPNSNASLPSNVSDIPTSNVTVPSMAPTMPISNVSASVVATPSLPIANVDDSLSHSSYHPLLAPVNPGAAFMQA
ncbi:hypothetical protein E1B28_010555 [Marasmius oreades]|uniref:Uncharacterized protein n=1 Tax=Marasmius oreades TaxID=181124 RepID=A0A9P7RXE8_9AGAR|nr:uncharacterized protein E1B28_010555 [Marasmius oreades]KAG7091526.1 hypothetical protein E1B28_010555 [Marasmius oreades]